MTDIVAFLTARLDEDQALAEAAHQIDPAPWSAGVDEDGPGPEVRRVRGNGLVIAADEVGLWDTEGSFMLCMTVPTTRHVAHWHPGRVLRDVAAKRRILGDILDTVKENEGMLYYSRDIDPDMSEPLLCALAEPYADHPDFDPAWALPVER